MTRLPEDSALAARPGEGAREAWQARSRQSFTWMFIASDSCTLTGSSEAMRLIEATRLNDRFDFNVLAA